MAKSKSLITLKQIEAAATLKSFQRGESYYQQGAIQNAHLQESRLWGDCGGSEDETYELSVTFSSQGIQQSYCSCPYNMTGICKHQVALLLTYLQSPHLVLSVPPLKDLLKSRSREELVQLIEQMLSISPNLVDLLNASSASGESLDLDAYRRQTQRAFQLGKMKKIAMALAPLLKTANLLVESDQPLEAGQFYQVLLEESINCYDWEMNEIDYNGDIGCLIQDMASGLVTCLEFATDIITRKFWMTTLLNGELKNIEMGGMDFAAGAWEGLLELAEEQEWIWIEALIRQKIAVVKQNSWETEALVSLLVAQREIWGTEESEATLIEEIGSSEQRIFLMAKQQRWDEAINLAEVAFTNLPGLVLKFADMLLDADLPEKALAYILAEQPRSRGSWYYNEWLAKYYTDHGDDKMLLELAVKVLQSRPTIEKYLEVKSLMGESKKWQKLQKEVLAASGKNRDLTLMMDILIVEEDWKQAVKCIEKFHSFQQPIVRLKVAQALEIPEPDTALLLYEILVNELVQKKHRSYYQEATVHLQKIRSLLTALKRKAEWPNYVQQLKLAYPTLKAFHEELSKANLS